MPVNNLIINFDPDCYFVLTTHHMRPATTNAEIEADLRAFFMAHPNLPALTNYALGYYDHYHRYHELRQGIEIKDAFDVVRNVLGGRQRIVTINLSYPSLQPVSFKMKKELD